MNLKKCGVENTNTQSDSVLGLRIHTRAQSQFQQFLLLPACRHLLFPLLHAEKEIGDVCTQAMLAVTRTT